jgi:hypothetical protein
MRSMAQNINRAEAKSTLPEFTMRRISDRFKSRSRRVHGHAKPRDAGEAAGTGHVVEAGAGVQVMAAAGASSNGGTLAVAAVGKSVAADTNDQVRVHKGLRRVNHSE